MKRPAGSWAAVALFFLALLCGWEALAFVFACALLPFALRVAYPHWRFYAGVGAAFAVYVVLALVAGGPGALALSQGQWGAASLFKALSLIVSIPAEQMIFHPMDLVFSWVDDRALAALGLAVALAIAWVLLRDRRRELSLALGLTACVVPAYFFAVESEGALWEPGLYLLAAAVCVCIGAAADLLARMRGARPVVVVLMVLLLGAGFVSAAARNSVWSDPEQVWKEVLEVYPNSGVAKQELAEYYRSTGRAADAAELATPDGGGEFSRAMKLNNEGVAMMDVGRLTQAVTKFREALQIWPELRDAHFNLGVAYHNLRMDDSALVSLRRAQATDPMHADTRYNLGIVYDSLGDAVRAETAYREAVSLDEGHARAWANLGALLGRSGDFEGAIDALERALRMDPGLLPARFNLALAYENVDVEKAKEEWRAYLNLARRRGVDPARLGGIQKRIEGL